MLWVYSEVPDQHFSRATVMHFGSEMLDQFNNYYLQITA
jgi:hypothetical protein